MSAIPIPRQAGSLPVTPQRLATVRARIARACVEADELRERCSRASRHDEAALATRITNELDNLLEYLRGLR